MTYQTLGKSAPYHGSEDKFQASTAKLMSLKYKTLYADAFHVPNGGNRNLTVAQKLKAQGVKKGVADWIFLHPVGKYHGLIIELKVRSRSGRLGTLSPEQKTFLDTKANNLYLCFVIYNMSAFEQAINMYLNANNQERKAATMAG